MINRVLQWLLVALLAGLWISCEQSRERNKAPEYFAFMSTHAMERDVELWGIMNQEGQMLFKDKFESFPKCISDNRFFVQHGADSEDYYFQLYTLEAEPKPLGEKYKDVTPFYDGVALVSRDNKPISLIDTMGRVVLETIEYGGKPIDEAGEFNDACAYVKQGDLFGFVNTKGEVHIPPKYIWVTHFRDGYALVVDERYRKQLEERDYYKMEILVIDPSGKRVGRVDAFDLVTFMPEFLGQELASIFSANEVLDNPFVDGKKVIYGDTRAEALKSITGQTLFDFKPEWQLVELLAGKYLSFYQGAKCGLALLEGEVLLQPQFDAIEYISENRFFVTKMEGGEAVRYIVDEQGERISNNYSELLSVFANGNVLLSTEGVLHLVRSSDGHEIVSGSPLGDVIGTATEWVCNRQIDVERLFSFLNITDRGVDGQTLEATTDELVQKHALEHQIVEAQDCLGFEKSYGYRQAFYTYYFGSSVLETKKTLARVLTLKPEALCVELWVDTFLNFVPTQVQRTALLGQMQDLFEGKGKLLHRSEDELVVQSPAGLYIRVYLDHETKNLCLVYARSIPALNLAQKKDLSHPTYTPLGPIEDSEPRGGCF